MNNSRSTSKMKSPTQEEWALIHNQDKAASEALKKRFGLAYVSSSKTKKKPRPRKRKKAPAKDIKADPPQIKLKSKHRGIKERRMRREERAPGGGVTEEEAALIKERDGQCLRCGRRDRLVIDHVVPLYKGGRHDPDNLQTLCSPCNIKKGLKIVDFRDKKHR